MDLVRRPAVTIHAIHSPNLMVCEVVFEIRITVLSSHALSICHSHPRDMKKLVVGGDVFDLVRDVHVPVNSAHRTICSIAAAHVEQKPNSEWRVLLVGKIMLKRPIDVADVFLRPMALLTDRWSRTRIVWEMNRAIEII